METQIINAFPGYEFRYWKEGDPFVDDRKKHNMYRGTDVGKGGYIRSWPGMYGNVALLDVASLHPNSIRAMNCFGEYTKNFTDILDARIAIKHKDFESARTMLNGKLAPYLNDPKQAKSLSQALKIAINSVYGLTAASFDNPFRDPRNLNNIVALRGALFMRTLQDEVTERGFKIVAIKTDSIKIADATPEIIEFCFGFAKGYGYTFEHEATYEKMCQINDADYIAKYKGADACKALYGYIPEKNGEHSDEWTATGAQFAVPYVFKTLFSREEIEFKDLCETKEVKSALYLDMNESLPDVAIFEKQLEKLEKLVRMNSDNNTEAIRKEIEDLKRKIESGHQYVFIGKVGSFCPIRKGCGGGLLMRSTCDGKYAAATGTRGYRWMESEMVRELKKEGDIDRSYYDHLTNEARDNIAQYGDFEWFTSEDRYDVPSDG